MHSLSVRPFLEQAPQTEKLAQFPSAKSMAFCSAFPTWTETITLHLLAPARDTYQQGLLSEWWPEATYHVLDS
jgi:hypothetical protein